MNEITQRPDLAAAERCAAYAKVKGDIEPQSLDISDAIYHSGIPALPFNLSRGEIKIMVDNPPAYCHYFHPRLGGNHGQTSAPMALGSAIHAALLDTENYVELVDCDSFRTKEAKEKKSEIEERGHVAMTRNKWDDLQLQLRLIKAHLPFGLAEFFAEATVEQCIIWPDKPSGLLMRCKPDAYQVDSLAKIIRVIDIKTTGTGLDNCSLQRHINGFGADVQQVHYSAGLKAIYGDEYTIEWDFLYISTKAPYLSRLVNLPQDWIDSAARMRTETIEKWADCLRSNDWPGYEQSEMLETPYYLQGEVDLDEMFNE